MSSEKAKDKAPEITPIQKYKLIYGTSILLIVPEQVLKKGLIPTKKF